MDIYTDFSSIICHYGTPRHSGRYPWGSGEDPYQSISRGSLSKNKKKQLIKKAKTRQEEQKRKDAEETKKPKSLSEMSEDEIRQAISRLQLEKQYADLVRSLEPKKDSSTPKESKDSSTPKESKGKKFISDVLYNSGKSAATTVLTATFTYAGATAINKIVGKKIVKTDGTDNQKKK